MDDFSHLSVGAGVDEFGATNFEEMNRGVTPVFMREPVPNDAKSEAEGRPIFDEMEICRIFVAGDQFNQISCPVDANIKRRFSKEYAAWKEKGQERHVSGTPLKAWPHLTIANVKEFEALNIFNVEGLANIPDSSLPRAPGLRDWREKAKAWLASAQDGAHAAKLATENLKLRDDVEQLKAQVAQLAAQAEKPKGK